MSTRVTAIVPTFNGRELLDVLMPSLLGQTYSSLAVMVVDDGSTDGSVEHVRARWPEVEVVQTPANQGFAAAVNLGLRCASSEYVALLNNDLELDPAWLALLVETLDRYPHAASASGKTLSYHDRTRLDGAGNQLRWSGGATRRGFGETDIGQCDQAAAIASACAGMALFRSSAFEAVGTFDEDFVAYYEDVDWGFRAQLLGLSCRYEPAAIAYHLGGATHGSSARFDRLRRRNQLLTVIKCYPASAILRHWPKLLVGQLILLARGVPEGTLRRHLAALADVVRALPTTLRKRRIVQRTRRVPLSTLESVMTRERYQTEALKAHVCAIGRTLRRCPPRGR